MDKWINCFTSEDISNGSIKYQELINDELFVFNPLGYGNIFDKNFDFKKSIKFEYPDDQFSFSDFKVFNVELSGNILTLLGDINSKEGKVYDRDALVLKYDVTNGKLIQKLVLKTPESVGNGSIEEVDNITGFEF